ncbi:hypothetical protein SDC9_121188 [bioreactor metagenome]|uniref:Uncharacterized protein n=1 Tax=bioreactor metagenome TaxID=1076179 RepID=A0A645CB92_9ZZZZ
MIDQLRAIDNRRLMKKTGDLPKDIAQKVIKNIQILLSVD